jgi:lipoprotein NlpI
LGLFYSGQFDKAKSDLAFVAKRRPDDPYKMLWLYLAEAHVAQMQSSTQRQISLGASALVNLGNRANAPGVRTNVWPYAVIDLFLGWKSEQQTQDAAGESADFECEASFYIGEWYLLKKRRVDAVPELKNALKCRHEFIEYWGAKTELERLEQNELSGAGASASTADSLRSQRCSDEAKKAEIQPAAK